MAPGAQLSERARTVGRRLRAAYRDPSRLVTVERARTLARRRVPPAVFNYLDGAAETETTLRANRTAMMAVGFRPRMGMTLGEPAPSLATTVLGQSLSMPVILGPVGFTRMMDRHGDVAAARAAGQAGTAFTLSSMSGHTIEEVVAAATGPAWFQLYFLGGRQGAAQLVDRAQRAGFEALVVTMDTQIPGNRVRELSNPVKFPLQMNLHNMVKFAPQVALHPDWLMEFARDRFQLDIANATTLGPPDHPMTVEEALWEWTASPPRWEDFSWIRQQWQGPIIAKGIVTGDDARRAVDCGVSAIVVSNHGGRQLDGMPATLPALVEVLDAVGDSVEVLVDGGVRWGSDVIRALALGARAVMIGRAWAYGLAAAGEPGIEAILSTLRVDMDRTLRLLGCQAVTDLDRSFIRYPSDWDKPGG
jgi:isopentenyl diphosphate isomerase/L-lactate dehydrogenase-like FMN-dependent dehydrogenase